MSTKPLALLLLSASSAWAQSPGVTQYTISTIAGNGVQGFGKDGPASGAEFSTPAGIAVDSTGAVYVADRGNNRVRQILAGTVTTFAGNGTESAACQGEAGNVANAFKGPAASAEFSFPVGLALRGTGDIFVADDFNNCVREVTGGNVKTYAGNGLDEATGGSTGFGTGPAVNAELDQPYSLAWDAKNNLLYIGDVGLQLVRVVNSSGLIQTVAGGGVKAPSGVDPTTAFVVPVALAVDSTGNLYISDQHTNTVLKIANGTVNIYAGGGSSLAENVLATQAELQAPQGLAFDPSGNLLIAEALDCRIRVVSAATGMINTIAGSTGSKITCGYSGDATPLTPGTATLATLSNVSYLAVDSMGNVYFSDSGNNVVRQLTPGSPAPAVCPAPALLPTTAMSSSAGSTGTFNITSPANCPWTATTTDAWITGLPQNGPGGANPVALAYTVMATTSSAQRTGTITVKGTGTNAAATAATFTITQAGVSCSATFNPPGALAPSADTKGSFNVMFNADDCAWLALSTLPWVTVTDGLTGTGKGDVGYEVTENKSVIPRPGAVVIDFLPFIILQLGASPTSTPSCSISFTPAPPANAPATGGSGNVGVNFPANATGCSYTASAVDTWVHVTTGITGSSNGTVGYTLDPNTTTSPRSGTLVVSGQPYTITEAAGAAIPACTPSLNPGSLPTEAAAGGSGSLALTFPNNTCGWTSSSNVSWLTITSGLSGSGNGSIAYTIAANATSAARTGAIAVSGQTFTVNQSGSTSVQNCSAGSTCPLTIGSIISASAYGGSSQAAPGSILEIYGTGLANDSRMWGGSDFQGSSAPLSLDGVTVTFNGQPGAVSYINPLQVNAQVPTTLSPGAIQVTVTNNGQTSAPYSLTLSQYAPGLLAPVSFDVNGNQYAVAFHSDQSYVLPAMAIPGLTSSPAQPGETIVMYGIGMGPVSDPSGLNIPGGQMVANLNSVVAPVQVFFGQTPAVITYAGLAPNFVGLYQVNVVVPQIAAGDTVPLTFTLNGTSGSQSLVTSVQ